MFWREGELPDIWMTGVRIAGGHCSQFSSLAVWENGESVTAFPPGQGGGGWILASKRPISGLQMSYLGGWGGGIVFKVAQCNKNLELLSREHILYIFAKEYY